MSSREIEKDIEREKMDYKIVELKEKIVVGLLAKTSNMDPNMGNIIGGLWNGFYQDGVYFAIEKKISEKSLGIYTDYANREHDEYSVLVACEVADTTKSEDIPQKAVLRTIPAGKYAKFIVHGNVEKAVAEFWEQLWQMKELNRSFVCDFEEYQNGDMEHAEIHIYIGLKDK